MLANEVLDFWFGELTPDQHWQKSEELDATINTRFSDIHTAASQGELYSWRENANGRLAEIIILDQFSRNIYRDTPRAFASDGMALLLAQEGISQNLDQQLSPERRCFFYMPFMHSESAKIHVIAEQLFEALGNESSLNFERKHKAIIDKFGRYPHRNKMLGRASTAEEAAFLEQPDSSF